MNQTKKLLLVDSDALHRLQTPAPASSSYNDLDQAMQNILAMNGVSDREKWGMYNQQLLRFLTKVEDSRKPLELPITDVRPSDKAEGPSSTPKINLLQRVENEIPPKYRQKSRALYHFLHSLDNLSWDSLGRISINGTLYDGSNLIDIIGDLMRARQHSEPVAIAPVLGLLKTANVARELIGNKRRWEAIQEGGGGGATVGQQQQQKPQHKVLKWERFRL